MSQISALRSRRLGTGMTTSRASNKLTKALVDVLNPKRVAKYKVFNNHHLKSDIIQYCAGDVALLLDLWDTYSARLHFLEQRKLVQLGKSTDTKTDGRLVEPGI